MWYGFAKCGNKFHCRESYKSAEGVLAHLENVDAPLQVAAKHLKSLEFHGPQVELDKLKEKAASLSAKLFVLEASGELCKFSSGGRPKRDGMVSIVPYFEVPDDDVEAFAAICSEFHEATKTERGCLHYGFTRSGNAFHCRESYKSGEDAAAHLKNVAAPLGKVGKYLKSLAIMGPKAEIEKTKAATEGTGATFWELDAGAFTRVVPAVAEMKVSLKKSIGFYAKSATAFLKGLEAQEATDEKEAVEALPSVEELRISGLGEAINPAVATAMQAVADGLGTITKIETLYPEMSVGHGCAQIAITLKRT